MAAARCPKTSSLAFFQWQVGLNKEDRADPEEQKRREMIVWIQDMVSELEKVAALLCFFWDWKMVFHEMVGRKIGRDNCVLMFLMMG